MNKYLILGIALTLGTAIVLTKSIKSKKDKSKIDKYPDYREEQRN